MIPWEELPDHSRVWIYQSSRNFTEDEVSSIQQQSEQFVKDWNAHGASLLASIEVFHQRFIVIFLDEKQAMATGCSIDKLVHLIKSVEEQVDVDMMDRLNVAWLTDGEISSSHVNDIPTLIGNELLTKDTKIFNNIIANKSQFMTDWEKPLVDTWVGQRL